MVSQRFTFPIAILSGSCVSWVQSDNFQYQRLRQAVPGIPRMSLQAVNRGVELKTVVQALGLPFANHELRILNSYPHQT